jgi:hypothetical protein
MYLSCNYLINKEQIMRTFFRFQLSIFTTLILFIPLVIVFPQPYPVLAEHKTANRISSLQPYLKPAIVFSTIDRHIHELVLKDTWQHYDLTAASGAPLSLNWGFQPMAFVRSDGVPMVIFRGKDYHVIAIYMELPSLGNNWQQMWQWADLTAITGSHLADSEPFGYVRNDGISTVVYIGIDGHVHDLRLEGSWIWADLTNISGAPNATGRAIAYVRGDGVNTVIYPGPKCHVYELRLENTWKWADLTNLTGSPETTCYEISAYVRSEGISTINYRGTDAHIHDIRYENNNWIWSDLTTISGAPGIEDIRDLPYGYVRADGINAIVYNTGDFTDPGRIFELRLDKGWQYFELTSIPNAIRGDYPVGYVRADGISAVVYMGKENHIQEIRLEEEGWIWADLTALIGAPAAIGHPWPYNRSVFISYIYLPLVVGR